MNYELRKMNFKLKKTSVISQRSSILLSLFFVLCSLFSFSQVKTEIDTTRIRIGEQINYKIKVEADSSALVVFPEGQTFMPLENVEALKIDTTKKDTNFLLSRIYKLTQFDSGSYTIPRQKIIINEKAFFTDSLRVDVNTIEVDTTKQKLYDIKPIIEVEKSGSNWWKWVLGILLSIALVAFLLYWFIWRKKPLTEEEEIALLPPYDRAKLALQKLDESQYLIRAEVKDYYSELTFIIRKYLDEKVYDRALESTTSQLISRLQLLKDGNQIDLSKDTIKNLESILMRADLVKFAKSAPDTALAEMDKVTIDKEIDHVKESLPEPTEEEKLLDQQYKEEQERKKKRKKVILTAAISAFLLIATFVGFGVKYGFGYVKDTIVGNESKELLEGDWVESAYGFPPIYIETPKVLKRISDSVPEEVKDKIKRTVFGFESANNHVAINVITDKLLDIQGEQKIEDVEEKVKQSIEQILAEWETKGVENIITKGEQFITPNNAEGIKTFGTGDFPISKSEETLKCEYTIFSFTTNNTILFATLIWLEEDQYADDIIKRVIDSIELKSDEQADAEQEAQN